MLFLDSAAHLALLGGGAFLASTVAGIAGFGGAAILLPILVFLFGVREAIPILTIAQLFGNGSRVWFHRRELVPSVVGWFALGGVPAALVGGLLFAVAPLPFLKKLIGAFLLFIVAYRRWPKKKPVHRFPLRGFAPVGALFSFLSALTGSVGPIMAPFFLSYGLTKGAYLSTEALATVVMHVTKLVAYQGTSVLTFHSLLMGLSVGPIMITGSYVGKKVVDRLSERFFLLIIEAVLLLAGLAFLIHP